MSCSGTTHYKLQCVIPAKNFNVIPEIVADFAKLKSEVGDPFPKGVIKPAVEAHFHEDGLSSLYLKFEWWDWWNSQQPDTDINQVITMPALNLVCKWQGLGITCGVAAGNSFDELFGVTRYDLYYDNNILELINRRGYPPDNFEAMRMWADRMNSMPQQLVNNASKEGV